MCGGWESFFHKLSTTDGLYGLKGATGEGVALLEVGTGVRFGEEGEVSTCLWGIPGSGATALSAGWRTPAPGTMV